MSPIQAPLTTRNGRIAVVLSGAWCIFAAVISLMMHDDHKVKAAGAFAVFLVLSSPVIAWWAWRWVRGAEPSESQRKKLSEKSAALAREPNIIWSNSSRLGIKWPMVSFIIFAALGLCAASVHIYLYTHISDVVKVFGWGRVPPHEFSSLDQIETVIIAARIGLFIAAAVSFVFAYSLLRDQLSDLGITGLSTTTPTFMVFFIIPLINLVLPWLALAKIDRACLFMYRYGKAGALWNMKGFRGFSWLTLGTAVFFLLNAVVSKVVSNEIDRAASVEVKTYLGFVSKINELQWAMLVGAAAYAVSGAFSAVYLLKQHRRLKNISYGAPVQGAGENSLSG